MEIVERYTWYQGTPSRLRLSISGQYLDLQVTGGGDDQAEGTLGELCKRADPDILVNVL